MPPTIGTAMRLMISLPVPLPHRMGSKPATITVTVIAFGRTRCTAPSITASRREFSLAEPAARRALQACSR